jgi:hypothetical protein
MEKTTVELRLGLGELVRYVFNIGPHSDQFFDDGILRIWRQETINHYSR